MRRIPVVALAGTFVLSGFAVACRDGLKAPLEPSAAPLMLSAPSGPHRPPNLTVALQRAALRSTPASSSASRMRPNFTIVTSASDLTPMNVNGSTNLSPAMGGIGNAGVTGNWFPPNGATHAFYWSIASGTGTDLGTLDGGTNSEGFAVNDKGDVAGWSEIGTSGGVVKHAFLSIGGGPLQDIGTLAPSSPIAWAEAFGVNNSDQVAGAAMAPDGTEHAFRWDAATGMTDLGRLGDWSEALGIADDGTVMGLYFDPLCGSERTWIWHDDGQGLRDLGVFAGTLVYPMHMNAVGQITGYTIDAGTYKGFVYSESAGAVTFGTSVETLPTGMNSRGDIVGATANPAGSALLPMLWSPDNGLKDLSAMLPSVAMLYGINDDELAVAPPNLIYKLDVHLPPVAAAGTAQTVANVPVTVTVPASDPDGDAITYAITTQPQHGSVSGDGPDYTYTPATDFAGTDSFAYTVTDPLGALATGHVTIVVLANRPPVAVAGGNDASRSTYAGVEGGAITFDASGSSDPDHDALTYAWSFGDGATASTATATHAYADDGTYTATLIVTDSHGASASATAQVVVANVAPSVVASGSAATITSGDVYTLDGSFSDPGVNDLPWTYVVNWGVGSPTSGSTSMQGAISASHRYLAAGTYTVKLDVADRNNEPGSATTTLTVLRIPVGVEIKGGYRDAPIRLSDILRGDVAVVVLSSPSFDAGLVDVATVRIGEAAVARRSNGSYSASLQNVNGDRRPDLVLHFRLWDLLSSGGLNLRSRSLSLLATLNDGRQIAGTVAVRPM